MADITCNRMLMYKDVEDGEGAGRGLDVFILYE